MDRIQKEEETNAAKEAVDNGTIKLWKKNAADKSLTVHCVLYVKYPDTVNANCNNRKPPPVTKVGGTQFRSCVIAFHLTTSYHLACVKRKEREAIITPGIAGSSTDLEFCISHQNKDRAENIKRLMFNVYGDAKRLTTAAWNWP